MDLNQRDNLTEAMTALLMTADSVDHASHNASLRSRRARMEDTSGRLRTIAHELELERDKL